MSLMPSLRIDPVEDYEAAMACLLEGSKPQHSLHEYYKMLLAYAAFHFRQISFALCLEDALHRAHGASAVASRRACGGGFRV